MKVAIHTRLPSSNPPTTNFESDSSKRVLNFSKVKPFSLSYVDPKAVASVFKPLSLNSLNSFYIIFI